MTPYNVTEEEPPLDWACAPNAASAVPSANATLVNLIMRNLSEKLIGRRRASDAVVREHRFTESEYLARNLSTQLCAVLQISLSGEQILECQLQQRPRRWRNARR